MVFWIAVLRRVVLPLNGSIGRQLAGFPTAYVAIIEGWRPELPATVSAIAGDKMRSKGSSTGLYGV
jgi:hypothetical protein